MKDSYRESENSKSQKDRKETAWHNRVLPKEDYAGHALGHCSISSVIRVSCRHSALFFQGVSKFGPKARCHLCHLRVFELGSLLASLLAFIYFGEMSSCGFSKKQIHIQIFFLSESGQHPTCLPNYSLLSPHTCCLLGLYDYLFHKDFLEIVQKKITT